MELSPELKNLIDAALADGKITANEKKVLINRAVKEGHDEDEFKLFLDSLVQTHRSANKTSVAFKIKPFLTWVVAKKRRVVITSFILMLVVSFIGALAERSNKASLAIERGCENVEDCLTSYKFTEARLYASELTYAQDELKGIIAAEVSYYISQDLLDMAIRSLQEYNFKTSFNPQGYSSVNDTYNDEVNWFNNIIVQAIADTDGNESLLAKFGIMIRPLAVMGELIEDSEEIYSKIYKFEEDYSIKNRFK
jgi:hypothetical protein